MSWKRLAATLSAAVLAGWASSASATDTEYGRSGPFVGGGGTYAWENFSGDASATTPDDSWGYYGRGGYRFNEYFALQLDWDHYVGFDDSAGDTSIWMIGVSAKLYPFHGIVQPYVSAGGGYSGIDDERAASNRNDEGFAARFAFGIDFYITRNWALSTEAGYYLPTGGRDDYGAIPLSFGVLYRFY